MKRYMGVFVLLFTVNFLFAQAYRTQNISPEIYSLQVSLNANRNINPVLTKGANDYILVSFDRISDYSNNRLRYRIFHCDAFWNKSQDISEIDYLSGFNDNYINDYAPSINTTVEYTHFNLEIPNRDADLKLSGNYVVEVYEDGVPETTLLTACFSVIEPKLSVAATVSSSTDIDVNKSHQQLSFTVHHQNLDIRDVSRELKVFALQNNRLDTERKQLKPTYIYADKLVYEHNRDLIFEAGNEYRRFEISSHRYNGLNVEHIEYRRPGYLMFISPDKVRAGRSYSYDQDQNGRYFVRTNDSDYNDTEADYFTTIFTLQMDTPLSEDIYINGDFTNHTFSNKYKMVYDSEEKVYKLPLLLKQGLYNYLYLTRNGKNFSTSKIEGNYHEAENEYTILVYYRPSGQRYDSLIGIQNIQSRVK
ncbi:MAG: DUF5103 domain-containing protein [Dysgonomonas sp.]|nr:DUF5103 domain-containing protein [Dysgonomonas sp.]